MFVKERRPHTHQCALPGLPFHSVRLFFDVQHEDLDHLIPTMHIHEAELVHVTFQGNYRPGLNRHYLRRHSWLPENRKQWLMDAVFQHQEYYRAFPERLQSCLATTPSGPLVVLTIPSC
jgi:hypothetical protein